MPFIARWPGHVPVGQSDQLICHIDLAATCAALLDEKLPDEVAVDSFNILPALGARSGRCASIWFITPAGSPADWQSARDRGN